ncbi:MAP3K epsilon protein kinase 1 [Zea mays]|uniref:non-specific serine/threonine protein kinase n=1 Tax=Zea mays TaxID=4577 RepID=A0A1D6JGX3_MAIZE|nr:MAP3K epsilon protein kinase 1 [Zea mays]
MASRQHNAQFHKSKTLDNKYMLGDEIGKGAYGRVYKGLDLENGDFVAIKQVSLENIPQEDLNIIMVIFFFLLTYHAQELTTSRREELREMWFRAELCACVHSGCSAAIIWSLSHAARPFVVYFFCCEITSHG